MKKSILFILSILIVSGLSAQEYIPMLGDSVVWKNYGFSESTPTANPTAQVLYTLNGDTTIDNTSYKKVNIETFSSNLTYPPTDLIFLREDVNERKVYVRFTEEDAQLYGGNQELLLYDFSLAEGESFTLWDDFEGNEVNIIEETTYTIDGEERRAWITDFPSLTGDEAHTIYVEGIGYLSDLLMPLNFTEFAFYQSYVVCYQNEPVDVAQYFEYEFVPEYFTCGATLSTSDPTVQESLRLFPNPADNFVNVQLENLSALKIVNITGVVVDQIEVSGKDRLKLDTHTWEKGLYLFQACNSAGNCATKRVIVR